MAAAVVALHNDSGSAMWMDRPLPPILLHYAAHDIEIIARVYLRFEGGLGRRRKGKSPFYTLHLPELKMASARYVRVIPSRAQRARFAEMGLSRFMPLEVLKPPPKHAGRFTCYRCDLWLSLACFSTNMKDVTRWRLSFCKLCTLLAHKESEESVGEWVVVE